MSGSALVLGEAIFGTAQQFSSYEEVQSALGRWNIIIICISYYGYDRRLTKADNQHSSSLW